MAETRYVPGSRSVKIQVATACSTPVLSKRIKSSPYVNVDGSTAPPVSAESWINAGRVVHNLREDAVVIHPVNANRVGDHILPNYIARKQLD